MSEQLTGLAAQADRHELYQKSVQCPETEIEIMSGKFEELRGRKAESLREDFCGTALLAVDWCKAAPERTAVGVDLCDETLAWGQKHNVEPARAEIGERVQLIHGNVLNSDAVKTDINCAFNFSYNIFKTRQQLLEYFIAAKNSLKDDGVFFLDIYGGTESQDELEEEREVDDEDFTYVWEQEKFNPITHELICHIHFQFEDGTEIRPAFSYDWRLWSIPEVSELLKEAGFSEVKVYWEEFVDNDDDEDEYLEGTGNYHEQTEVENQESWVNYIAALV